MGIFDLLFRRPRMEPALFPTVVQELVREFEAIREQFLFGGVSGLKSEGAPVSGISPLVEPGSELDAALKAFQLTNIMGFAWKYMDIDNCIPFDKMLTSKMTQGDANLMTTYRERYMNCVGNIDRLSSNLADDIHRLWGTPEPSFKFKRALANGAITLGIVSQAATANVFGDFRTERNLKEKMRL